PAPRANDAIERRALRCRYHVGSRARMQPNVALPSTVRARPLARNLMRNRNRRVVFSSRLIAAI
ncbi:hypothetical protein, partial [Bradyrhizobium sp. P5_C11_2]